MNIDEKEKRRAKFMADVSPLGGSSFAMVAWKMPSLALAKTGPAAAIFPMMRYV